MRPKVRHVMTVFFFCAKKIQINENEYLEVKEMEYIKRDEALSALRVGELIYGECCSTGEGRTPPLAKFETGVRNLFFFMPLKENRNLEDREWGRITKIGEDGSIYCEPAEKPSTRIAKGDFCIGSIKFVNNNSASVSFAPSLWARANNFDEAYGIIQPQLGDMCAFYIESDEKPFEARIVGTENYKNGFVRRSTIISKVISRVSPSQISLPPQTRREICKKLGIDSDSSDKDVKERISSAYSCAREENLVILDKEYFDRDSGQKTTHFSFPLSIKQTSNDPPIFVGLKTDSLDNKKWFVEFAGIKGKGIHKIFQSQIYVDPGRDLFQELADIALKENWAYSAKQDSPLFILRSYFHFTYYIAWFRHLIKESADGGMRLFNTGLVNYNYMPVFCVFSKTKELYTNLDVPQKWAFNGFAVSGEGSLGKLISKYIPNSELPQRVEYITDLGDLFLDTTAHINCDYTHMLIDNVSRLPVEMFLDSANRSEIAVVEEYVSLIKDPSSCQHGYQKMAEYLKNNDRLLRTMATTMERAVSVAKSRATWNYKTAVPVYYASRNTISLLLPLTLVQHESDGHTSSRPDVALVVSKQPSGNYQGETIFTLDMAYLDSRLITRPDSDWLTPENIDTITDETEDI